jgi:hypothetical protein
MSGTRTAGAVLGADSGLSLASSVSAVVSRWARAGEARSIPPAMALTKFSIFALQLRDALPVVGRLGLTALLQQTTHALLDFGDDRRVSQVLA